MLIPVVQNMRQNPSACMQAGVLNLHQPSAPTSPAGPQSPLQQGLLHVGQRNGNGSSVAGESAGPLQATCVSIWQQMCTMATQHAQSLLLQLLAVGTSHSLRSTLLSLCEPSDQVQPDVLTPGHVLQSVTILHQAGCNICGFSALCPLSATALDSNWPLFN